MIEFGQNNRRFARILLEQRPVSRASIKGDKAHASLHGSVSFYPVYGGTLVAAEIFGLPSNMKNCGGNVFAFHIHAGGSCSGTPEDPFENTGSHYNPQGCEHPEHAGDLPPLFENNGYAYSVFFTDRFTAEESIGRTAVIHSQPDDFHTQPSGNSGKKIACGEIKRNF